jgi:putative transposase
MPWDERKPMDERVRFVGALESCHYTMTELCEAFGISRKTGYKWSQRFVEAGLEGLRERSRAPWGCPGKTDSRCEEALVTARRERPFWGPRKLLVRLVREHPSWPWPAASTAGAILKRHGLVESRPRRRRLAALSKPLVEAVRANALWAADFKGEFRTGDRQLCYPLTVTDRFSRYLLGCRGRTSTSLQGARPVFEKLFAEYGLPEAILTDGGTPFASARSPRRLSRLSVWWVKLGIRPVVIQPGKPQQNGSHERMHRTLKQATARPASATLWRQQMAFDHFRREYNELRPHEGIAMKTPSQLYGPSPRSLPKRLEDPSYPGHFEVRRVRPSGEVKWRGDLIFLSEVLAGETLGLEETGDGVWSLYFGPLLLGCYEEATRKWDLL